MPLDLKVYKISFTTQTSLEWDMKSNKNVVLRFNVKMHDHEDLNEIFKLKLNFIKTVENWFGVAVL